MNVLAAKKVFCRPSRFKTSRSDRNDRMIPGSGKIVELLFFGIKPETFRNLELSADLKSANPGTGKKVISTALRTLLI